RNLLASFRELDRAFRKRHIDIVHTQTLAMISGALWAKRRGITHVWHVREIIRKPRLACVVFGFLLDRYADRILCNSEATRENLVRQTPRLKERALVILNGHDEALLRLEGAHRDSAKPATITLVGRLNRWKGHAVALEAAAILKSRGLAFRMI